MKIKIVNHFTFFIAIFIFILPTTVLSTSFYVDNSISVSGNGMSWTSAWKNFSNINWASIHGGDILYISGGSSSQTYYETLTIGASGTSGNPIIITKGIDAGHNGTVLIDGQNTLNYGVNIGYNTTTQNYVTIKNLTANNFADGACFHVRYSTNGVIFENNSGYTGSGDNTSPSRGIDIRGCTNVIVRNNSINTPSSTTAQTDGIWSSGNDGVVFEGNTINVSNSDPTGHSDCLQSYQDYNIIIRNNYFCHPNGGTNNHGLWMSDTYAGGIIQVYNNIVYHPVGDEQTITHWNEAGYSGRAQIFNNTVYGGAYCVHLENSALSEVRNNILVPPSGGIGILIVSGNPTAGNIDNNLIWAPNATVANFDWSTTTTWAQWQALGYDTHGINADPKLTNVAAKDFTLLSGSPAIDKGFTLSQITSDKNATLRPQGTAYDIGAYEFVSITTGIDKIGNALNTIIYPNPFNTNFTLKISDEIILKNTVIKISDVSGREVKTVLINSNETTIDRGELQSGIYFYSIINNYEKIANGKLVIQN